MPRITIDAAKLVLPRLATVGGPLFRRILMGPTWTKELEELFTLFKKANLESYTATRHVDLPFIDQSVEFAGADLERAVGRFQRVIEPAMQGIHAHVDPQLVNEVKAKMERLSRARVRAYENAASATDPATQDAMRWPDPLDPSDVKQVQEEMAHMLRRAHGNLPIFKADVFRIRQQVAKGQNNLLNLDAAAMRFLDSQQTIALLGTPKLGAGIIYPLISGKPDEALQAAIEKLQSAFANALDPGGDDFMTEMLSALSGTLAERSKRVREWIERFARNIVGR